MSDLINTKIKSGKWKYGETVGTVIKETRDGYVVVIWENVNGDWHYTPEQFKRFEKITSASSEGSKETTPVVEKTLPKS